MNYRKIENATVYISEDNTKIVVTGFPEEEGEHNCDEMGCSSCECVIVLAYVEEIGL